MKKIMGMIMSRLSKPAREFNIENRAEKILNREKPIPAPAHPSTAEQIKMAEKIDPNFMEEHYKKDKELYDRLKQVFVSSHIEHRVGDKDADVKKPRNKQFVREFEYGFWEPEKVPEGRCQLRTALKFMADNQTDSEKHSIDSIAMEYKLDPTDVGNILEYYRVFQVVQPEVGKKLYIPLKDEQMKPKPKIETH